MWEDYGDNYKGVRICYNYKINKNYIVAKVCYAKDFNSHPALDFIANIQKNFGNHQFEIKNWEIWQHFFKPFDYRDEEEMRVLYFLDEEKLEELKNGKGSDCILKWCYDDSQIYPILSFKKNGKTSSFPFHIKEILLGRDINKIEYNQVMLEQMIKQKNIKDKDDIIVKKSSLYNTRS